MKKQILENGTLIYEQSRKALVTISALIIIPLFLGCVWIGQGEIPATALFTMLIIGGPGALIVGLFWRQSVRNTLRISRNEVIWGTNRIDIADIASVAIIEETTGSGMRAIEQPVLAVSIRDGGEVRCRALSMFIGTADKNQLMDAKVEIEKRVAVAADPGRTLDDGSAADGG